MTDNEQVDIAVDEQSDAIEAAAVAAPASEKTFTESQVQSIVRDRIRREQEAMQKRMDSSRPQAAQGAALNMSEYVHMSQIPNILEENSKKVELVGRAKAIQERVIKASETDPELKELMLKGNGLRNEDLLPIGELDLPNAPAVVKHLLKDKMDHALYVNAPSSYDRVRLLRDLSDKLDDRATQRTGRRYEVSPDVSSASDGDDLSDILKKYRR